MEFKYIKFSKGIHVIQVPNVPSEPQIDYKDDIILELNEKILELKEIIKDGIFLCDYADAVKGHYCIVKYNVGGDFWEFFNKDKWCSAGEVFLNKESAVDALRYINLMN